MPFRRERRLTRLFTQLSLLAFCLSLFLPAGGLAAPASRSRRKKGGLKQMLALGKKYFARKNYINAYKVWGKVGNKLVEKRYYEKSGKKPTVANIHFMIGYALFKAKKYQNATKYFRRTLSLAPGHPKAATLLKRLAKAGKIGEDEVGPIPCWPDEGFLCDSAMADAGGGTDAAAKDGASALVPPETKPDPAPMPKQAMGPVDRLEGVKVATDRGKARDAWDEGKRLLQFGQAKRAIEKFVEAYGYGKAREDVDYQLGHAYLKDEKPEEAVIHFQKVLKANGDDTGVHLAMGMAYSLSNDVNKEIASYERVLQMDPDDGEAHFMLALAYDKVDNSPKVLEHAQKAIRIDPEYKEKLKPRIKDSNVSKKIGRIVSNVLKDSKFERLTDEKIEEYAEEIGRILGEENLNTNEFSGGTGREKVKSVLTDIRSGKSAKDALNSHIDKDKQTEFLKAIQKSPKAKGLLSEIKKKYR